MLRTMGGQGAPASPPQLSISKHVQAYRGEVTWLGEDEGVEKSLHDLMGIVRPTLVPKERLDPAVHMMRDNWPQQEDILFPIERGIGTEHLDVLAGDVEADAGGASKLGRVEKVHSTHSRPAQRKAQSWKE